MMSWSRPIHWNAVSTAPIFSPDAACPVAAAKASSAAAVILLVRVDAGVVMVSVGSIMGSVMGSVMGLLRLRRRAGADGPGRGAPARPEPGTGGRLAAAPARCGWR